MADNDIKKKKVICQCCMRLVTPVRKKKYTRRGIIMTFYEHEMVCPHKNCGERI